MDETFRLRRSYRNQGLGFLLGFLAWAAVNLYVLRTDATIPHSVALAFLFLGVPLSMAGLSALMLVAYWQARLIIHDGLVTDRGVFREKSINLRDVTEARWRVHQDGGSVVLRTGSARVVITFGNYEAAERERIIVYLRSALPPEIQVGWNLYAYKVEPFESRPPRTEPGPDEVLLGRNRWDRYLLPAFAMIGLAASVAWWFTGELRPFTVLLLPVGLWAYLRFNTPAEGMVVHKLSASFSPDEVQFYRFTLLWVLVAVAGLVLNGYLRRGGEPFDTIVIVGLVAWFGVFLYKVYLLDRRTARRDREAADLAAKTRGESLVDPWPSE
jgi:hypothetical protein